MRADRYLKVILTVIALELGWIAIKDVAQPVSAQTEPAQVIVVGSLKIVPAPMRATVDPLTVHLDAPVQIDTTQRPLKIEADQPIKVEADKPLKVETVRYTPGDRPGE